MSSLVGTSEYIISFQSYKAITQSTVASLPSTYKLSSYFSDTQLIIYYRFILSLFLITITISARCFYPTESSSLKERFLPAASFLWYKLKEQDLTHCYHLASLTVTKILYNSDNSSHIWKWLSKGGRVGSYILGEQKGSAKMHIVDKSYTYSKMAQDGCPSSQFVGAGFVYILVILNLILALLEIPFL